MNGYGRMLYAEARLRSMDEVRSERLTHDPRVYRPDEDEGGPTPCVICEADVETGANHVGLVCKSCRAKGWTAGQCECGAPLTRTDQTGPQRGSSMVNRCKRCREEMAPRGEALSLQANGDRARWRRAYDQARGRY